MICHKCTGRGTKRHHRDCPHRGEGHKGRGARIAYLATLAVEHGLVLRVRRGRHGAGLSLPDARAHLAKRLRGGFFRGTKDDARALAAFHAGCDSADVRVTADVREPGTVRVWLPSGTPNGAVARAQRSLEDHMPADVRFIVDRATGIVTDPPYGMTWRMDEDS